MNRSHRHNNCENKQWLVGLAEGQALDLPQLLRQEVSAGNKRVPVPAPASLNSWNDYYDEGLLSIKSSS